MKIGLAERITAIQRLISERENPIEVFVMKLQPAPGKFLGRIWAFEQTSCLCAAARGMGAVKVGTFRKGDQGLEIAMKVNEAITVLGLRNAFE